MGAKLILLILFSIAVGVGIGSIPGLNEHLHWNIWLVLPISGALFGCLLAWLVVLVAQRLDVPVQGPIVLLLAIVAAFSYAMADFGRYLTLTVSIDATDNSPAMNVPVREAVSFLEFMKFEWSESTVTSLRGRGSMELPTSATQTSYIVDLLGVLLLFIGTLIGLRRDNPQCAVCQSWMKRTWSDGTLITTDDFQAGAAHRLSSLAATANLTEMRKAVEATFVELGGKSGRFMVKVEEFRCSKCGAMTLLGSAYSSDGKGGFNRIDELDWEVRGGGPVQASR